MTVVRALLRGYASLAVRAGPVRGADWSRVAASLRAAGDSRGGPSMTIRYVVTYEFDGVTLPCEHRGTVTGSSLGVCSRRALKQAQHAMPKRVWASVVCVYERIQDTTRSTCPDAQDETSTTSEGQRTTDADPR